MSLMVAAFKWSALVLILLGWTLSAAATSNGKSFGHCDRVVKRWAVSALNQKVEEDVHTLRDLLFFLHIPRTGGRTYFHCFLRKLYPNALECPRSYDKLRFDPSKPKCRLLVTHDDFSMMSKLPRESTSVMTILRNPVDRVFSTYEFSVEVAARFLVHPNLTSATRMAARLRNKSKGVSTLDIWPWKYLVPWMREDLFARRDSRRLKGSGYIKGNDPYDMEEMVIPLHEYINDPVAQDIVHNGATFQVAGLTNNSYFPESHEVRRCVMQHKELGDHVLQVAKKRLDNMLYVGLTEDHRESATMFANVVGAQVISQLRATNSTWVPAPQNKPAEQSASVSESDDEHIQSLTSEKEQQENEKAKSDYGEAVKENMTVKELMRAYESCISGLRKAQGHRRVTSLRKIYPANFTKEARLHVQEAVLDEIRSLNHLDMELYEYAKAIYGKESELATRKPLVTEKLEQFMGSSSSYQSLSAWNPVLLAAPIILVCVFIYAFINVRRTLKIKI